MFFEHTIGGITIIFTQDIDVSPHDVGLFSALDHTFEQTMIPFPSFITDESGESLVFEQPTALLRTQETLFIFDTRSPPNRSFYYGKSGVACLKRKQLPNFDKEVIHCRRVQKGKIFNNDNDHLVIFYILCYYFILPNTVVDYTKVKFETDYKHTHATCTVSFEEGSLIDGSKTAKYSLEVYALTGEVRYQINDCVHLLATMKNN